MDGIGEPSLVPYKMVLSRCNPSLSGIDERRDRERLAENRKRERQTQRGSDVLYRREFPRHALQRKGGLFEKHTDRVTQALNDGEYKLSTATGQAGCAPNGF